MSTNNIRERMNLSKFQMSLLGTRLMTYAEEKIRREGLPVKTLRDVYNFGSNGYQDVLYTFHVAKNENDISHDCFLDWTIGRRIREFYYFIELFHFGRRDCFKWTPNTDMGRVVRRFTNIIDNTLGDDLLRNIQSGNIHATRLNRNPGCKVIL